MTVQVLVEPVPDRLQVVELKVPIPLLLQETLPVGVANLDGFVTVAMHVVEWKSWMVLGEQLTDVEVGSAIPLFPALKIDWMSEVASARL